MFRRAEFRLAAFLLALVVVGSAAPRPRSGAVPRWLCLFAGGERTRRDQGDRSVEDDAALINTRHPENGETALAIVAKRRDGTWLRFLLAKDADPAIADKQGMTPLMHAALLNFSDGVEELLNAKAPVDQTNRRGETALILAVQTKNVAMVRLLMRRGANPDKADHYATGMSARDYFKRDDRTGQLVTILEAKSADPDATLDPVSDPIDPDNVISILTITPQCETWRSCPHSSSTASAALSTTGPCPALALARAAGLHANSLRDLDSPGWNPTAETLRKLENWLAHGSGPVADGHP